MLNIVAVYNTCKKSSGNTQCFPRRISPLPPSSRDPDAEFDLFHPEIKKKMMVIIKNTHRSSMIKC